MYNDKCSNEVRSFKYSSISLLDYIKLSLLEMFLIIPQAIYLLPI